MTSSDLPTEDFAADPTTLQEAPPSLPFVVTSPTSSEQDTPLSQRSLAERYSKTSLIGSGGMGEIHLTRDRNIGRSVALKQLHSNIISKTAQDRFLREARIQGQLEHPSIVPVYDLGVDRDGDTYFTMRHIRGRTLEEVVRALKSGHPATAAQFTRRKLLTLFSSICLTIHYAHSRGVLHRDLKPSNVMVGEFGEVYILDWGIAKILNQNESIDLSAPHEGPAPAPGMTAAGSILGTLGYMPPEQLRGDIARLDARSDVYALGMIFFELLTFERFHGTDNPQLAYQRTLQGHDDLPSRRRPDVPPELDTIFQRATATDQLSRFESARALSDAVEHFLDGDRDMARRQELAESHASRAAAATAAALAPDSPPEAASLSRITALQEITQALALDPRQPTAREQLGKLLTEMPRELPTAVKQAMDRSSAEAQMRGIRFGSLIYLSWLGVIAYVIFMGVRSWTAFAIPTAGVALILLHVGWIFRAGVLSPATRRLLAVLTFATIAAFSVWLGPFILVPMATAGGALVFSIQSPREERSFYIVCAALASLLPYLVEFTGLFPPAYAFQDGNLVLFPRAVQLSPIWTIAGLVYLSLSFTVVPAYYIARLRDSLVSAEEKLFLHAWHFEQITGTARR